MKTKVEKIIVALQPKTINGQTVGKSIIYKVLDAMDPVEEFNRRLNLRPYIQELKGIYEQYREDEKNYIDSLIKAYCEEENEKHKDEKEYEKLDPESIEYIPENKIKDYKSKMAELSQIEVTLKKSLKFTLQEVKNAKLDYSEFELIEDFVDFKTKVDTEK